MASYLKAIGVAFFALMAGSDLNGQPAPIQVAAPAAQFHDIAAQWRKALLGKLPAEIVLEHQDNWGHQAHVPSIQGIKPIVVLRNHGDWEKAKVVARDLPRNLKVQLGVIASPTPNRLALDVRVTMPASADLHRQIWQNGLEVANRDLRARFELLADLHLEGDLQPDGAVKLQLTHGNFSSKRFVVENVNGVGGDLARLTGGLAQHAFKPWQPAVLAEFQKTIIAAADGACQSQQVCAGVSSMGVKLMAARVPAASAPGVPLPPLVVLVNPPEPLPNYAFLGFSFELVGAEHRDGPRLLPRHPVEPLPAAHASLHEHWGLTEHLVRFVASAAGKHLSSGGHESKGKR